MLVVFCLFVFGFVFQFLFNFFFFFLHFFVVADFMYFMLHAGVGQKLLTSVERIATLAS